ncbi:type II secretion system F family protein [Terrihabitans sp. B22-R8]|uniref:type II secretion system F family protein n=1 Tax=Terrihabitans sp. B22-R8 TaxID=3425128 RepID=UPI00403C84D3
MNLEAIILVVLVALAAGAGLYVLAVPSNSRVDKRQKAIAGNRAAARVQANATRDAQQRRTQISESLKQLEKRGGKAATLAQQLQRAGLDWTPQRFYLVSALGGALLGAFAYMFTFVPLIGVFAALTGMFGLPRWLLNYAIKRRQQAFLRDFPNAIDIIVRGVKSGLPLGDCIRIVASEAQEPVRSEFRAMLETQAVGMPLGEAVERLYDRTGVAEANFFGIVIAIQSQSGGNLSEAFGNLARVLRERAKMKGKIQAMSMEAKASAVIIGALPILVGLGVYVMSPDYLSPLWETNTGIMLLLGGAFWMSCGIFVMRQMINFDF